MIAHLDNNKVKTCVYVKMLSEFTKHNTFVIKSVRVNKVFDKEANKVSDVNESVTYTVVETETFSSMNVKVANPVPVITQDELDRSDSPVFITFPLDKTEVRPYAIEFGKVKVSIVAPDAVLVTDAKK
ncbi:hypothetical protein D3Z58_24840 [Clostridiaceae bacterium]|nr:hypothetical protein [Clostridiaceae bacterium]